MKRRRRIEPTPDPTTKPDDDLDLDDLQREWGQLPQASKNRHPTERNNPMTTTQPPQPNQPQPDPNDPDNPLHRPDPEQPTQPQQPPPTQPDDPDERRRRQRDQTHTETTTEVVEER